MPALLQRLVERSEGGGEWGRRMEALERTVGALSRRLDVLVQQKWGQSRQAPSSAPGGARAGQI